MIDPSGEVDFRWFKWIVGREMDREKEDSS